MIFFYLATRYSKPGFGRVMTWNLRRLKCRHTSKVVIETVCIILLSANVIALQNAQDLDMSCLPCSDELSQDYEWPAIANKDEFRVLVKTRRNRSFSVKKMVECDDEEPVITGRQELWSIQELRKKRGLNAKSLRGSPQNATKKDIVSDRVSDSKNKPDEKNLHYVILTVKSDLNRGRTFIVANVNFPDQKTSRRKCMQRLLSDISNVRSEPGLGKSQVFMMGDFRIDSQEGKDSIGELASFLTSLKLEDLEFKSPITFKARDPITTLSGRRVDNILTNAEFKGILKVIGPDFPIEPSSVDLSVTLQRLYNNYMTTLYTSEVDGESDSIYECIKAYQISTKDVLEQAICNSTWVPSYYISQHLPQSITLSLPVAGKPSPINLNFARWDIDGDTFKSRLSDISVRKAMFEYLNEKQLAILTDFPLEDRVIDNDELNGSDIFRLTQKDMSTKFGTFLNADVKDGDPEMIVLKPPPEEVPDKGAELPKHSELPNPISDVESAELDGDLSLFTLPQSSEMTKSSPTKDIPDPKSSTAAMDVVTDVQFDNVREIKTTAKASKRASVNSMQSELIGLYIAQMLVENQRIFTCIYMATVDSGDDVKRIIPFVQKDASQRLTKCDIQLFFVTVTNNQNLKLTAEIFEEFKVKNIPCSMESTEFELRYLKETVVLTELVLVLDGNPKMAHTCTVELPGDENKRGLGKITDFREISTHYPLSIALKTALNGDNGRVNFL